MLYKLSSLLRDKGPSITELSIRTVVYSAICWGCGIVVPINDSKWSLSADNLGCEAHVPFRAWDFNRVIAGNSRKVSHSTLIALG